MSTTEAKSATAGSTVSRRRSSTASVGRKSAAKSVLKEIDEVEKEALPLTRKSPTDAFVQWVKHTGFAGGRQKKDQPPKVSILKLLSYSNRHERWLMAVGLCSAFVSGLGLPAWLILLAMSLDRFNNLAVLIQSFGGEGLQSTVETSLYKLCVAFLIVGFVALIAGTVFVSLWTYTGEMQALRIRETYVKATLKQDAGWFDTHDREELPTKIATSMVHIDGAIGRKMADTFSNGITSAGCLAVALVLNAPLALLMLCIVPVVGIVIMILSVFIRRMAKESSLEFSKAGAIATEVISGIKTVASLCAQPWALQNYEELVRSSQYYSIRGGVFASGVAGATGFLFYCTYTVAFLIGTEQVSRDATFVKFVECLFSSDPNCRVTGASVMCCIYGVILCATFFGLMSPGITAINLGRQSAVDVFDTIHRSPTIDPTSVEGTTLDNFQGGIEFRKVFFSYPARPENPIFYNFNLVIEPGQSVALVGPSGSGKSTIARLLLRFYDPQSGDLLVDGIPLTDLNVKWWRSQVGYVAQEPILFPGTLKYNIACGKEGATDEEVIAAAKAACADEFIRDFPDGYDTFYSGASIQLSGGQMQRIAIARAIIRNPSVILLDEATSALDSNSERKVQEALANVRKLKKVTTVTVAHRLSTIINSDQICVISDGSIAELGTHEKLLEDGGIYAMLCESQGITAESKGAEEGTTSEDTGQRASALAEADADIELGLEKPEEELVEGEELDEELEEEELAPLSRLWKYVGKDWAYAVMGIIGSCMVGALSPCESILSAQIVANFYTNDADQIWEANFFWTMMFFVFAGASLIGNLMFGCGLSVSGYRVARRMRVLAFTSIVRRNMGWFDVPEHSTGELTTRLAADAETVSNITGWQLGYQIRVISSLLTGVLIALIYEWRIGLIAMGCVPLVMAAAVIQVICASKRFVQADEGLPPATILEQGLRGIAAVQAYDLETKVGDDYAKSLEPEGKGKKKRGTIAGLVYGFSQFSIFISFALIFFVGSILLVRYGILFVNFFTSVLAVMFGAVGAAQVSAEFRSRQDGQAAAARIFKIVDEPLDDTDPYSEKGEKPSSLDGSITFESCEFYYPSRPDNLIYYKSEEMDGMSLSIAAKESVAFVGKSGCGKSTGLQLVLRFYEASAGAVRVDGHDVKDLNVSWLREQIGYVGQMPVLFSGTVRSNILLGKPDATEEEVVNAAKAANAHGFITSDLPDGYDSEIGPGGGLLSGGQKQRVAIARAIIKNPKILVLDEATAALDNESERIVQAALDDLQKTQPRTTLVVAHRLVTVKNCDRIAVLGDGGVRELGSHDSLLDQKGIYHQLWKMQGAAEEALEKKNQ